MSDRARASIEALPLKVGDHHAVDVPARSRWHDTGLLLEVGCLYEYRAYGRWRDAHAEWGPEGHAGADGVYRFTGWLKRAPGLPWFSLLGAVDRDRRTIFSIGAQAVVKAEVTGQLVCFANDVPFMYWNNYGSLSLTVVKKVGCPIPSG